MNPSKPFPLFSSILHLKLSLELFLLLFILKTCRTDSNTISPKRIKIIVRKGDGLIVNKPFFSSATNSGAPRFEVEDQLSVYNEGTVSIFHDLSSAFSTCYKSQVRTNLITFIRSNDQFLEVVRKITDTAIQLKEQRGPMNTYCETYIFNQTCHHTLPNYKIEDFQVKMNMSSKTASPIVAFPFDWHSDLYVVQYCDSRQHFKFWELYSAKDKLFVKYIYHQNNLKNLPTTHGQAVMLNLTEFSENNKTKFMRRQNLEGLDVIASVFLKEEDENDNAFEVEVGENSKGEEVLMSGLSVSMFHDFRSNMNFTEKLLKIYFGGDNYFISAFTSDEQKFDINLIHSSVTKNRSEVAKPLHSTFFDGVHTIFVQPIDQSVRNIYIRPFAWQMWNVLLLTWTLIFFSCKLVMYLRAKLINRNDDPVGQEESENYIRIQGEARIEAEENDDEDEDPSGFEVSLWCLGAICQQGWDKLPSASSMRVIFMTSLILSVVCYAAFTGKIVSELWSVPKPIKSLTQLLSYSRAVYLVEDSDTSYDVLEGLDKRAPDVLKKIKFSSIDDIYFTLVGNPGRSCVITWPDTVTSYIQEKRGTNSDVDAYICETFTSFKYQSSSSLFVPKESEFASLFNYRIIVGLERGFIRRYWNTYKRESFLSCLDNNVKVTTLDFTHVFFAFFVLFGGSVISVVVLVSEVIVIKLGWRIRFLYLFSHGARVK